MPFSYALPRQVLIYVLVGVGQLAFDLLLFQFMVAAGIGAIPANFISRLSAGVLGFIAHRLYTFRASWTIRNASAFLRFIAWWLACTLLGGWVLGMLVERLGVGVPLAAAKVGLELVLALVSFLVFRQWVFGRRSG